MSAGENAPARRVVLVDRARRDGIVLEQALAAYGWTVMRAEDPCAISPHGIRSTDAILLALDGDDAEAFELLLRLSSLPRRPTVVLMTRRADARVLGRPVLASLGVDRVAAWPARTAQIAAALEAAQREHELEGGKP